MAGLGGGGGGGAAAVKMGGAFVEITGKESVGPAAKAAEARLRAIQDKTKIMGMKVNSVFGGMASQMGGMFEPLGLGGAAAGLAVGGALKAMDIYQQRLNKSLERGAELAEEFNAKFGAKAISEKVLGTEFKDLAGEDDAQKRRAALEVELKKAEEIKRKTEDELNKAKDRADRLTDTSMQLAQAHPGFGKMFGVEDKDLPHVGEIAETEEAVKRLRKEYQEAQAAIQKMQEAMGNTTKQDGHVKALREAIKAEQDMKKSIDDLTKSLQQQIDTHGMSANEAQIHAMKVKGASDAELADARAKAAELKRLDARPEAVKRAFKLAFDSPEKADPDTFTSRGTFGGGGVGLGQLLGHGGDPAVKELKKHTDSLIAIEEYLKEGGVFV